MHRVLALFGALMLLCAAGCGRAEARTATPHTLRSVFAQAHGGDVIHLSGGHYRQFAATRKRGWVTLVAKPHARVRIDVTADHASYVRFEGLEVTAAFITHSSHIAFRHNRFTGPVRIYTDTDRSADILFDGNTHRDIDVCRTCYEGRITVRGFGNHRANGVRIVNSLFAGGDADGVQVNGGAYGTQIGPGNRFVGIRASSRTHTDAIQLAGSHHTRITGNFFYDVPDGIMAPDGADHEEISGNVISTGSYPFAITLGADVGSVVENNTLAPGVCAWSLPCGVLVIGGGNPGVPSRGSVVRSNLLGELSISAGSAPAAVDGNVIADKSAPPFTGGGAPTSWPGFRLATASATAAAAGACSPARCDGEPG